MKDFQEDEHIEQTLVSIWKEFAWYLKEVARKHDSLIESNREKFLELHNEMNLLKRDFENHVSNQEKDERRGWTIAEKIVAAIGSIIIIGLMIWANIKQ